MLKKSLVVLFAMLMFTSTQAQDKVKSIKPFRIGAKIGVPNIVGGNAEFVFFKRIAAYVDYSSYSGTFSDVDVSFNDFEAGVNIYFNPTGKGFYGSFGFSNFSLDGSYTGAQTDSGIDFTGQASGSLTINTVNAKLGLKLGRSFYFRTEVGYGFGTIPDTITITGTVTGGGVTTTETGTEAIPDIPGISTSGMLLFNIGFGIGF
jgi:hypothetical protein